MIHDILKRGRHLISGCNQEFGIIYEMYKCNVQ